jgi:hypothetical protein
MIHLAVFAEPRVSLSLDPSVIDSLHAPSAKSFSVRAFEQQRRQIGNDLEGLTALGALRDAPTNELMNGVRYSVVVT